MAETATRESISDEEVRELARRWDAGWAARSADQVVDCCTDDILFEDPSLPESLRGKPAFRAQIQNFLDAFPDIEIKQEDIHRSLDHPDVGTSRWRLRGTLRGTLQPRGFAPTNQRVEIEAMALVEMRDGHISRIRQFYDTADFARQIGAGPPRGGLLEEIGIRIQRLTARRLRKRAAS
jgi:steroid delta-isomerase-like uncharacterized protein